MSEFVTLEISDGIGTIRLNRPPMNTLNRQMQRELQAAALEAAELEEVKAVIVYGGEKVFAAGADVKEMAQMTGPEMAGIVGDLQRAIGSISEIPKPTVAAISGYALGGGLEVVLCADRRIIGDNGKLGLPEVLLGIIPGGGGTQRLARLIGPSKAKDIVFTGRFVDADEALSIGLVDEVVAPDEVYNAARRWAAQFTGGASKALAAAKVSIDEGLALVMEDGLKVEQREFASLFNTEDQKVGMESFIANGPGKAKFVGK